MARKTELIQLRNSKIREEYHKLCKKYPQWRYNAIIDLVSVTFFLTPRTITAIINQEGVYAQQ